MKLKIDNSIQDLAKTKTYSELSKTELEFVKANCSKIDYENYYSFFKTLERRFKASESEISLDIKASIFNSFNKKKTKHRILSSKLNNPFIKSVLAAVAVVFIFISVYIFNFDKEQNYELTNSEFLNYTQPEDYGLKTEPLDDVTLVLQSMDFKATGLEVNAPSCSW